MSNQNTATEAKFATPLKYREAATTVGMIPMSDKVIIQMTSIAAKISVTGNAQGDIKPVLMTVVAYGESTHGFELGDAVLLSEHVNPEQVNVKGNPCSFAKVKAKALADTKRGINHPVNAGYELWTYILVPAHTIIAKFDDKATEEIKANICRTPEGFIAIKGASPIQTIIKN